jgi:hypothetical protein
MVVVVTMMVMRGRERRACKHQEKNGCSENLFHATNLTLFFRLGKFNSAL